MKVIVHKGTSLGLSCVPSHEPTLQIGHFLYEVRVLPRSLVRKGYLAVLIGEVALVEYFKPASRQEEEASQVLVTHKRLADVVDLSAHVLTFGVRQKQNAGEIDLPGSDVHDLPVWSLPNGMELCLDEYAGELPNSPARELLATMGSDLIWNNGEAFVEWLSEQWHALHFMGDAFRGH